MVADDKVNDRSQDKRLPKDCLSEGLVHEECISMVNLFIECKRQLVNVFTILIYFV